MQEDEANDNPGEAGVAGGEDGRKKLKSNDRRRMNGRPVYRRWINEFIPQLQAEAQFQRDQGKSTWDLRAEVRDDAFARFYVESEYRERLRVWMVERRALEIKGMLKDFVPTDLEVNYRGCLMSALRKIVMDGDQSFGVFLSTPLKDADGIFDIGAVRGFVTQNWRPIGDAAWIALTKKAQQNMSLKAKKRKALEEAPPL